jgi:protein O-mannosyl-transferase
MLSAALAVAVLIVYTPALKLGFVNFDDSRYVLDNLHVRSGLTWNGIVWAATATYAGNWHPVTWLSHMADVHLYGLNPAGHHATSVLIHLLNTLLLFAVLRRMTGAPLRSAVVAGLFGIHPLHVESVAWIAERKDVLSGLFAMLTVWGYVRYVETGSRARYGLVLLFFVLGLASKPMLVTLPFVLLLLDIWPLARVTPAPDADRSGLWHLLRTPRFRTLVIEKVPLFACVLVSVVVTYLAQQGARAIRTFEILPPGRRLANAIVAYVNYIGQMIWPVDLAPLYPYAASESPSRVVLSALMLIGLTVLAVRAGARYAYAPVGWFWYVGTLVPVIGLIQVGSQPMADRYTYLPLIGLFIVVAWGLPDVMRGFAVRLSGPAKAGHHDESGPAKAGRHDKSGPAKAGRHDKSGPAKAGRHDRSGPAEDGRHGGYGLAAAAVSAMIVGIVLARQQVAIWGNSIDLWQHTLRVTSDNYRAHNNLAHALVAAGREEEARVQFEAALRINPDSVEAHTGLGSVLLPAGRLDEAMDHYRHALRVNPNDAIARANLGAALGERGKFAEAEEQLRAAVALAPNLAQAHSYLGVALAQQGRTSEAIAHFARAVELQPDNAVSRRHLGSALAIQGRHDEALAQFEAAVRLDPADVQVRIGFGEALEAAGKLNAAVLEYEKAVQMNPALAEARADLGNSLARLGRADEALVHLREAVRIRPQDSASRYDLAVVLWRKGQVVEARQQLEVVVRQDPAYEPAIRMLMDLRKHPAASPGIER